MRRERKLVGLVGHGAIGREVHAILCGAFDFAVLLRPGSASRPVLEGAGAAVVTCLEDLLALGPDIAVEAAGAEVLETVSGPILEAGCDLVPASTGGLGDAAHLARLVATATRSGARILVPAGAIGGLDYLSALPEGEPFEVLYTSRKPPAAWRQELERLGHACGAPSDAVTLFEGGPQEGARLYPRNLNAGLTVALAVGPGRTRVRVVADPSVAENTHEITVESALGTAFFRFANKPSSSNPKTSAITGHSIAAVVRRRFSTIVT
ncbi:aspartate dehydrogenase domain-containing protein [Aureimonas altamirensis]|uniref:aspartate dehydrogenase domain-containing protein n=1 Tax=Aureimonas altamirensis TaxID=370622 RepID=UPI002552FCAE|nr:aspartate dehydrogenase domain-containing protein [Aureimonas altamirensis]